MRQGSWWPDTAGMTRTRILCGALTALALLATACGGGDDDDDSASRASTEETAATTTTEVPAPGNPDGDFLLLRWSVDSDNPTPASTVGLATTRLWSLSPTCEGNDPCGLTPTGAGEGGSFDPPEFGGEAPPETTVVYEPENDVWALEQDLGASGNCRGADGNYIQGDFTTMDGFDRSEYRWDESGTRLVGTKTETYTLNDAGRANAECSPDSDEVISYDVVLVPQAEIDAGVDTTVELADEYVQTREVYSVEGTEALQVFDWRVFEAPATGAGSCGPDTCDATLTFDQGEFDPLELELSYDDGELTASGTQVGVCITAASAVTNDPEVLTEEGYDVEFEMDLTPIVLDEDGNTALVGNGHLVNTPLPEAAAEFPDDCATVEDIGAYQYLIPAERAG